ncbi:MAG: hypothetical protein QOE36_608 [Gaiellaceae bacterium]|nr:hypothetical protein [Gaiellaceae bacterium]
MAAKTVNRRIRLLLAVLGLAFAGTLVRATWIQTVRAAPLSRMASSQHTAKITIPAGRGTIYDRMGTRLAIGEQATTVYADPREVTSPRAVARAASRTLGVDPAQLYPQLTDRRHGFVYVARQADTDRAAALMKLKLPGVFAYQEERRWYPQALAAQVLGFAGVDNRGLAGLELSLDKELAGRPGSKTVVKDPAGQTIDVVSQKPERPGRDVRLVLDHTIQGQAEQVLRDTVRRWGAKDGTAVVLDPRNGDVLAMAVGPTFDPNRFSRVTPTVQKNRAVTDTYEPGSTFKLMTVAGALSDGLVSPQTSFVLPYSIHVADRVIHDAEPRGTETMTVAQILSRSSNVGAITLAKMLGPDRLAGWIERFGFGRPSGIDFPGESPGIVLPLSKWSGSTIGNVPIGQGIAVTPIQMAAAYAAVANHGVWVQPHLVDHVAGRPRPKLERRRIVSRDVADAVVEMLKGVVADGTGTLAAVSGYQVAGKTGTAAKPDATGGYSTSKYVASFVGLVPASRPRLVIMVAIDEPKGQIFGGVVAAPAFQQIAQFDLQYLEVPPDGPKP